MGFLLIFPPYFAGLLHRCVSPMILSASQGTAKSSKMLYTAGGPAVPDSITPLFPRGLGEGLVLWEFSGAQVEKQSSDSHRGGSPAQGGGFLCSLFVFFLIDGAQEGKNLF